MTYGDYKRELELYLVDGFIQKGYRTDAALDVLRNPMIDTLIKNSGRTVSPRVLADYILARTPENTRK